MSEYALSKKGRNKLDKGDALHVAADELLAKAVEITAKAAKLKHDGWMEFWRENPNADRDVQYRYNFVTGIVSPVPPKKETI